MATRTMEAQPPPNAATVALAAILLAGLYGYVLYGEGWRQGALLLTGAVLGVALYHALFGFTSAWRSFLAEGRGAGLRAQMVMLALASAIFLPVLASGSLFGTPVTGAVAPVGISVLVGAFLFGMGMQLGGGCASGTLFAVGGGNARMVVTLAAFVFGSVLGTLHVPWWFATPGLGAISLTDRFGMAGALAFQLAVFAAIYGASLAWERHRFGAIESRDAAGGASLGRRLLRGLWPLLWGAVALALLNGLTLALAGHPWSVTFAFALWGAKVASALGVDVAAWPFWTWPYTSRALGLGVFADTTSVMNLGIMAGAFLAAALAGRFRPRWSWAPRPLVAAVIGGLLLGYGARLAYGCNIGAFFSGIASGSLHGWLWLAAALAGNWIGLRLQPLFRLSV